MNRPGVYMVTRVVESVFEVVARSPEYAAECFDRGRLIGNTVRIQSVTAPGSELEERATRFCEWDGREIPAYVNSIFCSERCDSQHYLQEA